MPAPSAPPTSRIGAKGPGPDTQYQTQYHIAIGVIFLLISFGAFYLSSTDPQLQHFLIDFYTIPIIIAAIAFGWKWGLFYALTASFLSWIALFGGANPLLAESNYLSLNALYRAGLLLFIGVTAGYVSEREKRRQEIYQKITQTIEMLPNPILAKDAQEWFQQVLMVADRIVQPKVIDTCSLMLLAEEGDHLHIRAARGLREEIIRTTRQPVGQGIVGQVMQTGKPMLCRDFVNVLDTSVPSDTEHKIASSLCIPLSHEGNTLGVMNFASYSRVHPFDELDLSLLIVLARAVATNIEIANLQKGLKDTYLQTIHSLARTIDTKDKYTGNHSEKVATYAMTLARHLHLTEAESKDLHAAALLHDIGKIGVPDAILLKAGPLTPEEYEEVKKHCVLGMKILEPLENMQGVAKLVLHHQERYDGTGYPHGLKGTQIPIGSRILSVVDAFHAMTSNRVYRKSLPIDHTLNELERNKGKQFDSEVVDAFLEIFHAGGFQDA